MSQKNTKLTMTIVSIVLFGIAIPLIIMGVITIIDLQLNFFSYSVEETSRIGTTAFIYLVPGLFLLSGGACVFRFVLIGRFAKFIADETSPAVSKFSESAMTGVKKAGGIDVNVSTPEKIMIKCQLCGTLNDEDAAYCDNCGEKL